jgi:hypothetical protein
MSQGHLTLKDEIGTRGALIQLPPRDDHCLRCDTDVRDDAVPYWHDLHDESGTVYVLCWDCMPSEEQAEIIEWEATIPEEDRLLS